MRVPRLLAAPCRSEPLELLRRNANGDVATEAPDRLRRLPEAAPGFAVSGCFGFVLEGDRERVDERLGGRPAAREADAFRRGTKLAFALVAEIDELGEFLPYELALLPSVGGGLMLSADGGTPNSGAPVSS